MRERFGKKKCKKCIYGNGATTGLPNVCNYILITGHRRGASVEECKIGLKKKNQGEPLPLPDFNDVPIKDEN